MKRIFFILLLVAACVAGWWGWQHQHTFKDTLQEYIDNGDFLTLEAKYTAEQLMETHRSELLPTAQHAFLEPVVKFAPYLLIDSKFSIGDKGTKEGMLLWGLTNGEIVIDTGSWEETHGYEDAINAGANKNDFRILFALAKNNGSISRDQLQNELHLEREILDPWIEAAVKKQLVVQTGNNLQIHLEDPKIWILPQTKVRQAFVTKPYNQSQRLSRKYTKGQVEEIAKAAFGSAFTIRNVKEIFLPIYSINVQNPDGSILTSYWNALTGKQVQVVP